MRFNRNHKKLIKKVDFVEFNCLFDSLIAYLKKVQYVVPFPFFEANLISPKKLLRKGIDKR